MDWLYIFHAETILQEFWCNSNVCISWNNHFHIYNWVSASCTLCTLHLCALFTVKYFYRNSKIQFGCKDWSCITAYDICSDSSIVFSSFYCFFSTAFAAPFSNVHINWIVFVGVIACAVWQWSHVWFHTSAVFRFAALHWLPHVWSNNLGHRSR